MTKSKTRKPTGGVQHGAVQDRAGERGVVPEAEPDPGGAERQAERDRGQARGGQRDDARRDHGAPDQALAGQERSFALNVDVSRVLHKSEMDFSPAVSP